MKEGNHTRARSSLDDQDTGEGYGYTIQYINQQIYYYKHSCGSGRENSKQKQQWQQTTSTSGNDIPSHTSSEHPMHHTEKRQYPTDQGKHTATAIAAETTNGNTHNNGQSTTRTSEHKPTQGKLKYKGRERGTRNSAPISATVSEIDNSNPHARRHPNNREKNTARTCLGMLTHDKHEHIEQEPPRAAASGVRSTYEQSIDQRLKYKEKNITHTHWAMPMHSRRKYTESEHATGGGTITRRIDTIHLQHTHQHPNNSKKSITYTHRHKLVLSESKYRANKRTRGANALPRATATRTDNILKQHAILRPCNKEKNVMYTQRDVPIDSNYKHTEREHATDHDAPLRAAARATRETKIQKIKLPQKRSVNHTYITIPSSNRKKNHIQTRKTNRKRANQQNITQLRLKQHDSQSNRIYMFILVHSTKWLGPIEKILYTEKAKCLNPPQNIFTQTTKPLHPTTYITHTTTTQPHQRRKRTWQDTTERIRQCHTRQASQYHMYKSNAHDDASTQKAWKRLEQSTTAVVLTRLEKQKKAAPRNGTAHNPKTLVHPNTNYTTILNITWHTCRTINQSNPQHARKGSKQTNLTAKNKTTQAQKPNRNHDLPSKTPHKHTTHRQTPVPAACTKGRANRMRPGKKIDRTSVDTDDNRKSTTEKHDSNIETYPPKGSRTNTNTAAPRVANNEQNTIHHINQTPTWRNSIERDSTTQCQTMATHKQREERNQTHQTSTRTGATRQLGIIVPERHHIHKTGLYNTIYNQQHTPCIHKSTGHLSICNRSA
jgi:hypothetical protein